jgi:hypothetical protein
MGGEKGEKEGRRKGEKEGRKKGEKEEGREGRRERREKGEKGEGREGREGRERRKGEKEGREGRERGTEGGEKGEKEEDGIRQEPSANLVKDCSFCSRAACAAVSALRTATNSLCYCVGIRAALLVSCSFRGVFLEFHRIFFLLFYFIRIYFDFFLSAFHPPSLFLSFLSLPPPTSLTHSLFLSPYQHLE